MRAIASKVAQAIGSDPGAGNVKLQLDGAGAHSQDQDRPGSGSAVGPEFAAACPVPQRGGVRHHGHPDAQRDLSRRCAGPRQRRAAHVAVDHPFAADTAVKRADRSIEPDRVSRLRPGISDGLAPGPAAHGDGAGGHRARHAGRHGRAGFGAEDDGIACQSAEWIPHRRWRHR